MPGTLLSTVSAEQDPCLLHPLPLPFLDPWGRWPITGVEWIGESLSWRLGGGGYNIQGQRQYYNTTSREGRIKRSPAFPPRRPERIELGELFQASGYFLHGVNQMMVGHEEGRQGQVKSEQSVLLWGELLSARGCRAPIAPAQAPTSLSLARPPALQNLILDQKQPPPQRLPQPQLISSEKPARIRAGVGAASQASFFLSSSAVPGLCGVRGPLLLGTPSQAEG